MKKITLLSASIVCMVLLTGAVVPQDKKGIVSSDKVYESNSTGKAEMDLHGKNLNKFPGEVFEMKDLKVLDLSNNNITEIPADIKNLENLTVLKLNGNKIYELPNEISRLKMLKEIHIDRFIWAFKMDEIKKLTNAKIILED